MFSCEIYLYTPLGFHKSMNRKEKFGIIDNLFVNKVYIVLILERKEVHNIILIMICEGDQSSSLFSYARLSGFFKGGHRRAEPLVEIYAEFRETQPPQIISGFVP